MNPSSATKHSHPRCWAALLLAVVVLCSACDPGPPPSAKPIDTAAVASLPAPTEVGGGGGGPRVTVITQQNSSAETSAFPSVSQLPEATPPPQVGQIEVRPVAAAESAQRADAPVPQVGSLQSPKPIEAAPPVPDGVTPAATATPAALPVLEAKAKSTTQEAQLPPTRQLTAPPPPPAQYNDLVLKAIRTMPSGGGYALTGAANAGLRKAITVSRKKDLDLEPKAAQPSYCSGATYQVFLHSLQAACDRRRIKFTEAISQSLLMAGQPDGAGVWGRWNANGPGTARLFYETGIGVNFEDWAYAVPGDFLKIFWNENIGKREAGHSVVFLALEQIADGSRQLRFWSSNQPDGYGEKAVPISKVKRVIFSRITNPAAISAMPTLATDEYLKDMLKRDGTPEELAQKTGMAP